MSKNHFHHFSKKHGHGTPKYLPKNIDYRRWILKRYSRPVNHKSHNYDDYASRVVCVTTIVHAREI